MSTPVDPTVPATDGAPVAGQYATLEVIHPDPEQVAADKSNRKSRTAGQTFSAGGLVVIIVWLMRLKGVDLNPAKDSDEIPAEVVAAFTATLTYAAAVWMNRG